jgi:hypothetical protein
VQTEKKIYALNGNREIGFDSILAQKARTRFMNRDGAFNVARIGMPRFSFVNLYHSLLTMSWAKFLLPVCPLYFIQNIDVSCFIYSAGEMRRI